MNEEKTSEAKKLINEFIKNEALRLERDNFAFGIIGVTIGYIGITYWLNEIRATTPLWFLWTLIIIQLSLYLEIFIKSGRRSVTCGLNKNISYITFIFLAILGRINGLEIVIIPLIVIISLIVSAKPKNVSDKRMFLLRGEAPIN